MSPTDPAFDEIEKLQRVLGGDDPLLSLAQASKRLGVPLSTLSDAVRNGRLPALTMPDERRYVRQSVVRAYVARQSKSRLPQDRDDDALLNIAALADGERSRGLMPSDFAKQHDHYLYGTPKRK
jgi:excisionase family DNA binding protein